MDSATVAKMIKAIEEFAASLKAAFQRLAEALKKVWNLIKPFVNRSKIDLCKIARRIENRRHRKLEARRMASMQIVPTGTVDFAHRWRPYVRDGLRYTGRMRGDVGRCEA